MPADPSPPAAPARLHARLAAESAPAAPAGRLVIRPRPGWQPIDFRELWHFRELLWFLALRDVQVRYKQTVFGAAWAVMQPLFSMAVFSIFFGFLGHMSGYVAGDVPYTAYTFCALLPWQFFASALVQSSNSVVASRALLTKVYFPRMVIPLAPLLCCLLDFAISFVILVVMLACYGINPGWAVLALPLFLLLAVASALAVSLWFSALNALYHDVQYTVTFLAQAWMFATPVAYPLAVLPEPFRRLLSLNPMTGVVEGFRWCLLGTPAPDWSMVAVSATTVALLLVGGAYFFRRMEGVFADVV